MRMTLNLVQRLEEAEANSWANWWHGLEPDEALGLIPTVERIGGVLCARGTTGLLGGFNRAIGLGVAEPASAESIQQIRRFFERTGRWLLDLCPYAQGAGAVAHLLHQAGMRVATHANILAALPGDVPEPAAMAGVEVVTVRDANLAAMVAVNMGGYGMAPEEEPLFARGAQNLIARPGVTVYLALVDGRPASVGELHLHPNGVGFLAGAATLPEYRGRGLQRLLIRVRAAEARRQGCDLLSVQTGIGTQSQWNLEANGFRLVYTKTSWVPA